jgi:hypothetical protein
MNEATLEKHEGFDMIKALMERLILTLIGLDQFSLAALPAAQRAAE